MHLFIINDTENLNTSFKDSVCVQCNGGTERRPRASEANEPSAAARALASGVLC